MINFGPKKIPIFDIDPDEIFLDSENLPEFDKGRFEGQLEMAISKRTILALGLFFLVIGLVYTFRLGFIQLARGEVFAERSRDNSLNQITVYPNRGLILDRKGQLLTWNLPERTYWPGAGLGHLLGYIGLPDQSDLESGRARGAKEAVGKEGVEEAYNERLRGELGKKIQEVNVRGQIISESVQLPTQAGQDLVLTIDARLQQALFGFIEKIVKERGFLAGAAVLMDVGTGEILVLTNYPEYDPNLLSAGRASTSTLSALFSDQRTPFLNRVVNGLYAPGSIVKPIIAVGSLEEELVKPEKVIVSEGSISIANPYLPGKFSVFHDWKAHGPINLIQALAVSSNVYFYALGGGWQDQPGLGIEKIAAYARLFGLGQPTGIGLSGEEAGLVPTPEWKRENFEDGLWRLGDTYNTAIGQYGFQVTALQAVRYIAGLATARLVRPKLLESQPLEFEDLPISAASLQTVREGLRLAVSGGTNQALNLPGLEVSAKTGTAEVGTSKRFINSWVVGYFPASAPRWAFAVVMERGPKENIIGASAVFRAFLEWLQVNAPEYLIPS